MLVKAHADGLGVYLDELGQGILQPAPDGNRPADRQVELGELVAGHVARRVHRGSVLVDHGELALEAGLGDRRGDDFLGLVARRAVADRYQLQLMLAHRLVTNNLLFTFSNKALKSRINLTEIIINTFALLIVKLTQ